MPPEVPNAKVPNQRKPVRNLCIRDVSPGSGGRLAFRTGGKGAGSPLAAGGLTPSRRPQRAC